MASILSRPQCVKAALSLKWICLTATQSGSILYMRPANGRRRYNVTSPLIGWAHTQNDPCTIHVFCSGSLSWTLQWPTVRCRRRGKTRVQQITWQTNPRCRCWDGYDGTAGEVTWSGKYFTSPWLPLLKVKVDRLFDAKPGTLEQTWRRHQMESFSVSLAIF